MNPKERLSIRQYDLKVTYSELEDLHPLTYAAKYGVTDYIETILSGLDTVELGVIVNQANSNGLTPLHFACRYGQIGAVNQLLSHGALSKPTMSSGQFPIHMIFNDKNELETCEALFLLLQKDGIEFKTLLNENVAHLAALKGSVNILKIINDQNPKLLNCKDNLSTTPLLTAVINNKIDAAKYLIQVSDINIRSSNLQNALHIAAKNSSLAMLELLLPHFDIYLRDGAGYSALDIVKFTKQQDKEKLMEHWIDVHAMSPTAYSSQNDVV